MWDYYKAYWLPFGELLSDIEKRGICIDVNHLKNIEKTAWTEAADAELNFKYLPPPTLPHVLSQQLLTPFPGNGQKCIAREPIL